MIIKFVKKNLKFKKKVNIVKIMKIVATIRNWKIVKIYGKKLNDQLFSYKLFWKKSFLPAAWMTSVIKTTAKC